ncbi:tetratricopeptide repeat protein [Streptomyces sp. NPDC085540]|uniref:tetratricopeptide repeat protein n=1 Tax=Streptomyces sp. NPDC085540 TaxID=3365730 RepID=UPI0037D6C853
MELHAGDHSVVAFHIDHVTQVTPRAPVSWPLQVGNLPRPAHAFQDRSTSRDLHTRLAGGQAAASCWVLTGMGGVGKTQLAAHYARRAWQAEEIDLLVWVTAATREAVIDGYSEAAVGIREAGAGDREAAAMGFLAWLEPKSSAAPPSRSSSVQGRQVKPRWLIVLDDVADPADLRGLWPPSSPYGRTIVTTRRRDVKQTRPDSKVVDVGLFTSDEAVTYLTAALAAHDRHEPADQLAGLSGDLGHLPLVLSQAAAYLIEDGRSCAAYRRLLADRTVALAKILPKTGALPDDQTVSAAAAWSLSIDRANQMDPAGLALPMLRLAAVLDPNGIPQVLLTGRPVLDHLTAHRTPHPDAAAEANAGAPRIRFRRMRSDPAEAGSKVTADEAVGSLKALHRLCLIDFVAGNGHRMVRVHQLIQRTVRDACTGEEREQSARTAADGLMALWTNGDRDTVPVQALRANADSLTGHSGDALWQRHPHPVIQRVADSLRSSGQPTAAIAHYRHLADSAVAHYGKYDREAFRARHAIALCRGEAGDAAGAVTELDALLNEFLKVLSPVSPEVLRARGDRAHWRGEAGDAAGAMADLEMVLNDQVGTLGWDHPDMLISWGRLAHWRGITGDASGAATMFAEVLANQVQVLGADHVDTLASRGELATWWGVGGDAAGAATALDGLLGDYLRVLGPNHPDTLKARRNLARWRGGAGDVAGAVTAFEELVDDCRQVLGPDSPETLQARQNLALWRAESGDVVGAVIAFEELVDDCLRVLGPDSPDTLTARHHHAHVRGLAGDAEGAATALEELLEDYLRVVGAHHPGTVKARQSLARWRGSKWDPAFAETPVSAPPSFQSSARFPGDRHYLATQANAAYWRGVTGDAAGAARALDELLQTQIEELGEDHPDILVTWGNLAYWRGMAGDAAGAAVDFTELLAENIRVLGPYHPNTVRARESRAYWLKVADKDPADVAQGFTQLLESYLRALGPDHPRTLATRGNRAYWLGMAGDASDAATAFEELLQTQLQVLGPDHSDIEATKQHIAYWRARAALGSS